jgi:hypothetical protein
VKIETNATWVENSPDPGVLTDVVITVKIDACTLEQMNRVLKAAAELGKDADAAKRSSVGTK